MKTLCQWLLVVREILSFFALTYLAMHGRKASSPTGFAGFVGNVIGAVIVIAFLYGAGAFSCILP